MKAIIVGILLTMSFVVSVQAGDETLVTIDGNKYMLNVGKLELVSRTIFDCGVDEHGTKIEPMFEVNDFDNDGDLDDECVSKRDGEGVSYDPCTYNSVRTSIIRFGMMGGHCYTKAEYEEMQVERCDGFSPTPPECQ